MGLHKATWSGEFPLCFLEIWPADRMINFLSCAVIAELKTLHFNGQSTVVIVEYSSRNSS